MMRLVIMGKAIAKLEQELKELRKIVEELQTKNSPTSVYGPPDSSPLKDDEKIEIKESADKIKNVKKGLIRGGAKNINPAESVR